VEGRVDALGWERRLGRLFGVRYASASVFGQARPARTAHKPPVDAWSYGNPRAWLCPAVCHAMSYPSPPPSQSSTPTPAPGPEGWASPAARTLVPASALAAAAARAGVDAGALSVVEVPCASPQLYSAVLEYAALCPPVDGSPPRALWQNPEDEFEVAADEESESEGEGEESDDGEGGEREADVLPGRGLKKRRVPVPRLTLGLGQVEVVWPPPVGMTVGGVGRRRVVEEGDAGAGVAGRDGTVYVVHTALGEPVACNVSGVTVCRTVLLASAGGEERLRKFTRGVLTWRAEWDNRRARAGRFALYRFKTDPGCGRAFWSHEGLKRARPMASVVLREGMLEDILADVRSFLEGDTKAWYVRHGLPHRRSLLMEGPPGVGKTSCIRAIASEFELNCCFLSTTCKSFSNQMLGDALAQIPENALLVLVRPSGGRCRRAPVPVLSAIL
jgi:hypothetical protein